ncbi:uncharacterized protein SPAPADRAFT_61830, partial [Spathaspora passalidarum NRRL Y-27907]
MSSSKEEISEVKVSVQTSTPPETMDSSVDIANSNVKRKRKHKPESLKLSGIGNNNADVALRIVSPGLPSLSEEMNSTVQLSKQIQLQQRKLIAARQTVNGDSPEIKDEGEEENEGDDSDSIKSPVYASDDSELTRLSQVRNKRLKRTNLPEPLHIDGDTSIRPTIQSAPIRQRARPAHSMYQYQPPRPQQQQQQTQQSPPVQAYPNVGPYYYVGGPYQQYYPAPIPRTQHRLANAQITYSTLRPLHSSYPYAQPARVRFAPYTSTVAHFPHRAAQQQAQQTQQAQQHQQQPQQQGQASERRRTISNTVTDVYHGDLQRAAPLHSQPLSSQREYFQGRERKDEDEDESVTEDEVREMEQKYKEISGRLPPVPQYVNINQGYYSSQQQQPTSTSPPGEIFGSINLMNVSIFNFKIF